MMLSESPSYHRTRRENREETGDPRARACDHAARAGQVSVEIAARWESPVNLGGRVTISANNLRGSREPWVVGAFLLPFVLGSAAEAEEEPMVPTMSEYLATSAAARYAGIAEATLRTWANTGKVSVLNTPNGRLFHRDELERVRTLRRAYERKTRNAAVPA